MGQSSEYHSPWKSLWKDLTARCGDSNQDGINVDERPTCIDDDSQSIDSNHSYVGPLDNEDEPDQLKAEVDIRVGRPRLRQCIPANYERFGTLLWWKHASI